MIVIIIEIDVFKNKPLMKIQFGRFDNHYST